MNILFFSKKISLKVIPTSLRKNEYYYKIYYVYLNTLFASIIPLALLLFLNITTAIELIKMSRQESRILARNTSVVMMPPRITMSECSEQRTSFGLSTVRVMETEEDENLKALQPLTRYNTPKTCLFVEHPSQITAIKVIPTFRILKDVQKQNYIIKKKRLNKHIKVDKHTYVNISVLFRR